MPKLTVVGFDTETLSLTPRQPEIMTLESISLLRLELETREIPLREIPPEDMLVVFNEILEKSPSATPKDSPVCVDELDSAHAKIRAMFKPDLNFTLEFEWGTVKGYWVLESPEVLFQIANGRKVDIGTLKFHLKNGRKIESEGRGRSIEEVLDIYCKTAKGADVIWCRGTDFDIPLIGSLMREYGKSEPYRHYIPRDWRTSIDELLNDFEYNNICDRERLVRRYGFRLPELVEYAITNRENHDSARHQADVDVLVDMITWLALKFTRL